MKLLEEINWQFVFALMCHLIVFFVDFSVCFLEIFENQPTNYLNIISFNIIIILITWSHIQAIITDPGTIPGNYSYLNTALLPISVQNIYKKEINPLPSRISWEEIGKIMNRSQDDESAPHSRKCTSAQLNSKEKYEKLLTHLTKRCLVCHSIKPPKTHHCSECGKYY